MALGTRILCILFPRLPFGVFQDLFWRLKLEHSEKVAVSCPDVMFNTYERDIPDHRYAALAKKWDVKKWVDSNGRVRWYGCRRGYNHTSTSHCSRNQGMAVPPCDLENLADMVKFVTKKCEETGVYCEIKDGTLLGNLIMGTVCRGKLPLFTTYTMKSYRKKISWGGGGGGGGGSVSGGFHSDFLPVLGTLDCFCGFSKKMY